MLGILFICILFIIIGLSIAWYLLVQRYVLGVRINTKDPWFKNIKNEKQAVLGVRYVNNIPTKKYTPIHMYDRNGEIVVRLMDKFIVHDSIEELVEMHGILSCAPHCSSKKEAINAYHKLLGISSNSKEKVSAIQFM
jgi:hypothetical protein